HRTFADEVLGSGHLQSEQTAVSAAENQPAGPIDPTHGEQWEMKNYSPARSSSAGIPKPCPARMSKAAATPDSMVWPEVSRLAAPSATFGGAVERRLSAWSRAATASTSPASTRREARTS